MISTQQEQDRKRQAAAVGFWTALSTSFLNLWFYVTFIPYQSTLHAPWHGLAAYAASFQPLPYLAWVVPCFLLAPVFLTMITCLYVWAGAEKQLWSLLALVFAVVYAAVLGANYYIQMTVVPHNLLNGTTDGLALWLYANPYPYSIPGALVGVGFGFMCGSFLFAAQVFGRGKLQQWVRWSFVGTGLTGRIVFTDPLFPLPPAFTLADAIAAGLFLTLGPVLLAVLFRRGVS